MDLLEFCLDKGIRNGGPKRVPPAVGNAYHPDLHLG